VRLLGLLRATGGPRAGRDEEIGRNGQHSPAGTSYAYQ
jgi:hypothetical protein